MTVVGTLPLGKLAGKGVRLDGGVGAIDWARMGSGTRCYGLDRGQFGSPGSYKGPDLLPFWSVPHRLVLPL